MVVGDDIEADVRAMLEASLPSFGLDYRLVHRLVGVGSLGRPRFTLLAQWQGEFVALEAKAGAQRLHIPLVMRQLLQQYLLTPAQIPAPPRVCAGCQLWR